jgi:hypothetical protein
VTLDAMTDEKIGRRQEARLSVWDRLFHGFPVSLDELALDKLCEDVSVRDECAAYVVLRVCTTLSHSARPTVRFALRVAILYWFSNMGRCRGEACRPLRPRSSAFRLGEAIGTGLTWDEAVAAMKRKPIDFSAYLWLLEVLEAEYVREWSATFAGTDRRALRATSGDRARQALGFRCGARADTRSPRGQVTTTSERLWERLFLTSPGPGDCRGGSVTRRLRSPGPRPAPRA